jgi:thiol-disulfide isomerase/thioredoxin
MKKTVLFVIATLFIFVSCTKKKEVAPETQKKDTTVKKEVVEKEVGAKEIQALTADSFAKGESIYNIKMKSITTGKDVDFSQYKGKKILFDFWSSWCEPCIEMFPVINRLKKEIEDGKGTLKILSISVDPMPGKVKEIMKKKKVEFEVLNAPTELANSGILMPYLAVADENGKIIATSNGKHTFKEILKMIDGEKSPTK